MTIREILETHELPVVVKSRGLSWDRPIIIKQQHPTSPHLYLFTMNGQKNLLDTSCEDVDDYEVVE